jgi:hypothetical protein
MPRKDTFLPIWNYLSLHANKCFPKYFFSSNMIISAFRQYNIFGTFIVVFSLSRTTFECIWINTGIAVRIFNHVTKWKWMISFIAVGKMSPQPLNEVWDGAYSRAYLAPSWNICLCLNLRPSSQSSNHYPDLAGDY